MSSGFQDQKAPLDPPRGQRRQEVRPKHIEVITPRKDVNGHILALDRSKRQSLHARALHTDFTVRGAHTGRKAGARFDPRALRSFGRNAGYGRAAVDEEAHRLAIQLDGRPEMAVHIAPEPYALIFADNRLALGVRHNAPTEIDEVVLERETDEHCTEDQHPGSSHLEPLTNRN